MRGLGALQHADIAIVSSWRDPQGAPPQALIQTLGAAQRRGARLVGRCRLAYPVTATGLLDGLSATTHWSVADDFARRFPSAQVERDVTYVCEGNVIPSAGTVAGMDCCLHLLRQLRGAEASNRVAGHLVIAPHRAGGQAPFIDRPVPVAAAHSRLRRTLWQVTRDLAAACSVDSKAAMARMSRRSFTRRSRQTCDATPMTWPAAQRDPGTAGAGTGGTIDRRRGRSRWHRHRARCDSSLATIGRLALCPAKGLQAQPAA
jgi:transcriptional regulator GlxA family with amidase domain